MKLLIDLLACQTPSRFRGIGRYTLSLAREMATQRGPNQMIALANTAYRESFDELRQDFIRLLPPGSFKPYAHPEYIHPDIASTFIHQAYNAVAPDVILSPSLFEGRGEKGAVALPCEPILDVRRVAIVYDLIPFIYQNQYLDRDLELKQWYLERVDILGKFDLLLAISDSTRQDVINLLGIPPEKVINISGGASSQFRCLNFTQSEKINLLSRYRINRPFVLYLGGDDFRKNMRGALEAYSRLPDELIRGHQLVLNDVGDETKFRELSQSLGLAHEDIVITGHISEDDLVGLYNLCKIFFFPSLYEGFGLPVLEAMACGAPVIASNNSSLPELIGRADALFDVEKPDSITSLIHHVLTHNEFTVDLGKYGLERAKQFTWERSARRAWEAIEAMQIEKRIANQKRMWASSQPRAHIAYVSPLPPQKSGISSYSAELLPYLAQYFDIDLFVDPDFVDVDPSLRKKFAIYPLSTLLERRDQYSTVVYQMGNSSFHSQIYDFVEKFPGVVVLHDFYLSNLVAYVREPGLGARGSFHLEMDNSHGLRGLIYYRAHGTASACKDWPVNWRMLKYAQELVSHSEFHDTLIQDYYNDYYRPVPNIVKQLRELAPDANISEHYEIRKQLGINTGDFVFCSYGYLTPEKMNLIVIQAFDKAFSKSTNVTRLIFVGDFFDAEYKRQVISLIEGLGLTNRVKITGYVSQEVYNQYLIGTDVAIQIRGNTRGETSRAVLDCMASGLPTVINSHGTLNDYSGDGVIKLSDPVSVDELAEVMKRLRADEPYRNEKSQKARIWISENHDPENIAVEYAKVIYRSGERDERKLFAPLTKMMFQNGANSAEIYSMAKYAASNSRLRSQMRILIDVSFIAKNDLRSGIQRVVKRLIHEFMAHPDRSFRFELVRIQEGQLYRASRFTEAQFELPAGCIGEELPLSVYPGDTLFMLDSSWDFIDQFLKIFDDVRLAGGKIVSMVYDLIPIQLAEYFNEIFVENFQRWLEIAVRQSDMIVCISRSIADEVIACIEKQESKPRQRLDLAYCHLGSDIQIVSQESQISKQVLELTNHHSTPLFLMVGTLEPRKGHQFVLDSFEELWQKGRNIRLCFAGKVGWNIDKTERRILTHPELGKKLIFVENPTDAEIDRCYRAATALIAASSAEGFGLPIVEAALHQVPTLASDIPVFHEVGGEGALYFSLESPTSLIEVVEKMCGFTPVERVEMVKKIRIMTWKESAERMLDIIHNNHEVYWSYYPQ